MKELIELALRPAVPAEQALIEALKAEGGPELRGGITELLKACIRRGFAVLAEHAASGDADVAAHGDFEAAGAYRFKLLDVYQQSGDRPRRELPAAQPERVEASLTSEATAGDAAVAAASIAAPPVNEEPEPAAPPRRDWTRLRGIAGYAPPQEPK